MPISADCVIGFEELLFQQRSLQKLIHKDVNIFFVAQAVPEIYGKYERLKKRGYVFFVIDCIKALWNIQFSRDLTFIFGGKNSTFIVIFFQSALMFTFNIPLIEECIWLSMRRLKRTVLSWLEIDFLTYRKTSNNVPL